MDLDRYHDTSKTCLGGGMQCPSASSFKNLTEFIFQASTVSDTTKVSQTIK